MIIIQIMHKIICTQQDIIEQTTAAFRSVLSTLKDVRLITDLW